ncbi:alpha/beta hydrolase [Pelomonas sp. SE-A7]|uniref:alpha/beta hydrolase family protein n=1 Tax=Pelomonas sp. SE-A7 TaxID=3054953 RepID=UPI00259CF664|nr:alpha/beta hydrolase [Pelomonas sp. SE-A7]MDM4764782.1 alpha/beta hydrolase [Pelomonas sp. SE-A7]
MPTPSRLILSLAALAMLGSCASTTMVPEEPRPHDSRSFTPEPAATAPFPPLAAAAGDKVDMSSTSRWTGMLEGAAYRIEVPAQWNGQLVMYAHGYRGTGPNLRISNPPIRRYLIENGYAWAASSYSKNYYDARTGVEDTNALALAFGTIAAQNGRPLAPPSKLFITGHSMGGYISALAVEAETRATARHKVEYQGAVPLCGTVGDEYLHNHLAALQTAAQAVAGVPSYPFTQWAEIKGLVTRELFSSFPSESAPNTPITPTEKGRQYLSIVKHLSGGERPLFAEAITIGNSFPSPYGLFGGDGTAAGVLTQSILDTRDISFSIDGDPMLSAALNKAALRLVPVPDANRLRRDGLRWVPHVNGEFKVPVLSLYTLGDLFVPFSVGQVYQRRAAAKGSSGWLVQRAIRGAAHCDFSVAEQVRAFADMVHWERTGSRPAGDDVLTPATVAARDYGCAFTDNSVSPDEYAGTTALRQKILAATPKCP